MAYTDEYPFEAYITNLGKYNEGALVGEWVKFPTTAEEIQDVFKRIGIDGVRYEEWFITDYDCHVEGIYDVLGEYESLDELNYLATKITELDKNEYERFEAAIQISDYSKSVKDLINLTENLDKYDIYPDVHDHDDLGRLYIEEYGSMEVPDHLKNYIDYEAYGRDIAMDEIGEFTDFGYVRDTGDGFYENYDGNRENIPEEYCITSPIETEELSELMKLNMATELAFDLDMLLRQNDTLYAASHPDKELSIESLADILIDGKTVAIKEMLRGMGQSPDENLFSMIQNYEQAIGYDVHLDTDSFALHEYLEQAQDEKLETMTVLVVEPLKEPYIKEISTSLSAMQAEVGGMIAATYPFYDQVAVICNDEGKLNGMDLNRALRDDSGEIYDIVAGTFLVTGLGEENFSSLSPELAEKYMEYFKAPELFAMVDGELTVLPVPVGEHTEQVISPDDFQTGERIQTPRGSFSITDMTREQMEAAGYGYHHSSDDGKFQIMGNGTQAFAIADREHLPEKAAQISFYAAECMEFTNVGEYHNNLTLDEAIKHYEAIPAERMNGIKGIGFTLDDGSMYDGDFPLLSGDTIDLSMLNYIEHYRHSPLVQQAVYDLIEKMPQATVIGEVENHLKNTEMAMEDDYGMIDGIINNGSKETTPPGADEKPSIRERLSEAKQECEGRKPPAVKKPEKPGPEHDL